MRSWPEDAHMAHSSWLLLTPGLAQRLWCRPALDRATHQQLTLSGLPLCSKLPPPAGGVVHASCHHCAVPTQHTLPAARHLCN
jgi:hypothetical protein